MTRLSALTLNRAPRLAARGAAAAAGVAVLALAGCGSDDATTPAATTAPPVASTSAPAPVTTTPPPGEASSTPPVTADRDNATQLLAAGKKAEAAVDGTTLTTIELDSTEQGGTIWEVTLVDGNGDERKLEISADGKTVTRAATTDRQDAGDRRENRSLVAAADLTYAEAAGKLPSSVKGGRIAEMSLDDDDSNDPVWNVDVTATDGSKHEVEIDARSGRVLRDEID